jgi:hypothetical protein
VFVSGRGSDSNPCTVTQPCRSLQQAYNNVAANGEIEVLEPAGYGPFTITHGISIQGHGWASITQSASCPTCAAITINVTTSDPVMLNGLILDGASTGFYGINITSGSAVQILNSVVRHFQWGIYNQILTSGSKLLIEDTIASDNENSGIYLIPVGAAGKTTLSRITSSNNFDGVLSSAGTTTIANSVLSNNNVNGLVCDGICWLARTVISNNANGIFIGGATVNSYGDNYIRGNVRP